MSRDVTECLSAVRGAKINMIYLILIISVLAAAANCSHLPSSSEGGTPSNPSCEKWKLFANNKGCLKKYIQHVLPEEVKISTPDLRPTTTAPTVTSVTISHATPNDTVNTTNVNATTSSPPVITNITTPRPEYIGTIPEMDCLSLDDVKRRYSENLKLYQINKSKTYSEELQIGKDMRFHLIDKVIHQSKLKDLKNVDLVCIKNKKEELKNECLLKNLKTTDPKALLRNITYTTARLKTYKIRKETCELSQRLNICVKRVIGACPKALETFAGIENVTSEMCKDILHPPPIVPIRRGLPTIAVVFIVIACVCGALAVAYAVYKYLKIRRSRGHLNVTKNNVEECEMTTRSKPMS